MSDRRLSQKQIAALIVLAALGGYVMGRLSTNLSINLGGAQGGAVDSTEFVREDPGPLAEDSDIIPVAGAPFLGPGAAKVTIVEFSDFQCPYCSRANPSIHEVLEQNGDDVRLVFRHLPLPMHPDAAPAARAATVAHEMGQFWAYHDLLFANQRALDSASLLEYAESVDLDPEAFAARLESDEPEAAVDADMEIAQRLGLNGTPSFFVNGVEVVGALPPEEFQRVIDREIEAVDALLADGVLLGEVYRRRVAANQANDGDEEERPSREGGSDREQPEGTGAAVPGNGQHPIPDGHAELTVYMDYTDSASLELARRVERLRADYGDHLSVHYMPLADPDNAAARTIAAALGRAAAEGRFDDLHGFALSAGAPLTSEELIQWAQSHNLEAAAFTQALEETSARAFLQEARTEAERAGIVLQPTVRVGTTRLTGAVPLDDLRVAVNAAMQQ